MTKQEELEYRKHCPYDAMGDCSSLSRKSEEKKELSDRNCPTLQK